MIITSLIYFSNIAFFQVYKNEYNTCTLQPLPYQNIRDFINEKHLPRRIMKFIKCLSLIMQLN